MEIASSSGDGSRPSGLKSPNRALKRALNAAAGPATATALPLLLSPPCRPPPPPSVPPPPPSWSSSPTSTTSVSRSGSALRLGPPRRKWGWRRAWPSPAPPVRPCRRRVPKPRPGDAGPPPVAIAAEALCGGDARLHAVGDARLRCHVAPCMEGRGSAGAVGRSAEVSGCRAAACAATGAHGRCGGGSHSTHFLHR
eukprot:366475-Chlamydomonas_euryale.AAC.4